MEYRVAKIKRERGACILDAIRGLSESFRLELEAPLARGWPADAHFPMDQNFPNDLTPADFILNGNNVLLVSKRVKEFLEAEKVSAVEYLPVAIVNHKGRKEKEPFFIVHPLEHQDCIDLEKTQVRRNAIDAEVFSNVKNLTFDPKALNPKLTLFALKRFSSIAVFRADLAEKILATGFTGVKFVPPEKWSKL
jgi:hypothetical protein